MACPGDKGQVCGGSNRINLFTRPQYRYLGCYSDSTTGRTLRNRHSITNEAAVMTIDLCRTACRNDG
ncbi:hypothetical protein VF21_09003, partial [Pseudogymnoascus sp. 05NY08]